MVISKVLRQERIQQNMNFSNSEEVHSKTWLKPESLFDWSVLY
jgi:hypothetical protein